MVKDDLSVQIGRKLKQIRQARGLTLDTLAELTGVSKPMLGQIERGVSNPTVATLWKIASGLNVPFATFLDDAPTIQTLRADEQTRFLEDEQRYQVFHVSSLAGGLIEVFRLLMLPGCRRQAEPHSQGVVEHVTVSTGRFRMWVGDEVHELSQGDAIQFTADTAHVYENPFEEVCAAHLVIVYPDARMRRTPSSL